MTIITRNISYYYIHIKESEAKKFHIVEYEFVANGAPMVVSNFFISI